MEEEMEELGGRCGGCQRQPPRQISLTLSLYHRRMERYDICKGKEK